MRVTSKTVTGVAASGWLPLDAYLPGSFDGIYIEPGAGATVSVEVTPDDVFDPNVTPTAFPCGVAALTGATTNVASALQFAARAVRLNQTVGVTTSTITVVSRGLG